MRFRNIETGNIVSTEREDTIALMKRSDRYEEVTVKATPKTGKKPDNKKPE